MNEIISTLLNLLPPNRKNTSGGWISFNSVCCHHRGERPDTKKRGGVKYADDRWSYHCFNCQFKAGWSKGKLLSKNAKDLFKWLGLSDLDIGKLNLSALKFKDTDIELKKYLNFDLHEINLPPNTKPLDMWLDEKENDQDFLDTVDYLINQRGMKLDWYDWMYSDSPGFKDRIILPFYHDGKIVGYTGRKIKDGRPKYLTESQSGYIFNIDNQKFNRQFVIVVEGQFDAIAIDGVAIMTNEPNEIQIARINGLRRQVICVPDRDRAGSKLLNAAIENNWSVSSPPWENEVKDTADAVKKYGRLYTLTTILHYQIQGEIKINLLKKQLENFNE